MLKKEKEHLTKEGLSKIKDIISIMRKYYIVKGKRTK
jgi:hypothetical protein